MDEKLLLLFLTAVAIIFSILFAVILTRLLRKFIESRVGDFTPQLDKVEGSSCRGKRK